MKAPLLQTRWRCIAFVVHYGGHKHVRLRNLLPRGRGKKTLSFFRLYKKNRRIVVVPPIDFFRLNSDPFWPEKVGRGFSQSTSWPQSKLAEPNLYGVRRSNFLHFLRHICFFKPEKWWLDSVLSWAELEAKLSDCDVVCVTYDVRENLNS